MPPSPDKSNPEPQRVAPPTGVIVREPHLQQSAFPSEKPYRAPDRPPAHAPKPDEKK